VVIRELEVGGAPCVIAELCEEDGPDHENVVMRAKGLGPRSALEQLSMDLSALSAQAEGPSCR
jgi:hypothetical protein